jgi:L-2-hydroxyglutarate oxidase LhgO
VIVESVDCVVVGAGVIGLAVARRLALAGRDVLVLERADAIGTETSSRHSEVVHAGIYYRPGSWMARFCVQGKQALYRYCEEHSVPHRRCGKLIVASGEAEIPALKTIRERAEANGVGDLRLLAEAEARALEPALVCEAALLSPSTGIIDSHQYMLALHGDLEDAGGMLALNAAVDDVRVVDGGFALSTMTPEPMTLGCRILVNAAGLYAPDLARRIDRLPADTIPRAYFAKGNYFTLSGRSPFSRLIYPVPEPGGLGVHLTLDMAGQARFGPDVEWIDVVDYTVDASRAERFYGAIRRYWPDLPDGALQPGYAGIRPKIVPPDVAVQDFLIQSEAEHGIAGLINLYGIESPGMTSSLALADHVAGLVRSANASAVSS